MENAIEIRQPASLIEMALARGADEKALEKLEKVLELQERWEANEARKAYVVAMAEFKKEAPAIIKDKENSQFKSRYSSIDALVNSAIPVLSKNEISHSWTFGMLENGWPSVTCILTHSKGHSEKVTMSAPPDTSGGNSKNPIQQIKSTNTYLKIATFEAVTGLVSREGNLDDDGNASVGIEYITDKQLSELTDMLNNIDGGTEKEYLRLMKFESMDKIPAKDYERAKQALIIAKKKSVELKAKKGV